MKTGIHTSDFTEKEYRSVLVKARKSYDFVSYAQAHKHSGNFIILRHDIDFSPQRALSLAKIEHGLGIKSTFCIQLSSIFYNTFERDTKNIFLKIKTLRHNFGLHFDPAVYGTNNISHVRDRIGYEKNILEELLNIDIRAISFHNPAKWLKILANFKIAGLINTYSGYFMRNMKYVSDSNGYWRFESLHEIFESREHKKLHILIHPIWWQKDPMTPWKRIERCIVGRSDFAVKRYRDLLKLSGRKNIGYANDIVR